MQIIITPQKDLTKPMTSELNCLMVELYFKALLYTSLVKKGKNGQFVD